MELKVLRKELTAKSTIGELHVDGAFECYTLEDAVRPVKIKGVTAIPAGVYEVVVNFSQRFQRPLPLLLHVPNFDGVRIHAGNTDADTEGCLLVGKTKAADFIGASRAAFDALFAKIQRAAAREKIFIEIAQPGDAVHPEAPRTRAVGSARREITSARPRRKSSAARSKTAPTRKAAASGKTAATREPAGKRAKATRARRGGG
jgi:hypothetical protein